MQSQKNFCSYGHSAEDFRLSYCRCRYTVCKILPCAKKLQKYAKIPVNLQIMQPIRKNALQILHFLLYYYGI